MAYALFIVVSRVVLINGAVTRIGPPKASPSPVPEETVKLYESQKRKTDIVTINVRSIEFRCWQRYRLKSSENRDDKITDRTRRPKRATRVRFI